MFSVRAAVFLSSCSAGVGFLFGRKGHDSKQETKDHEFTYVFPTVAAKSKSSIKSNSNSADDGLVTKAAGAATAINVSETTKYGFPSFENVRSYEDFILSYDKRNRTANWVLEHLTPSKVDRSQVDRVNMKFVEDQTFHSFHRSTNNDFQGSGYDRGHLAAAANHRQSHSAMSQTFILSNVAPQVGEGFNRDTWNNLEKYTRAIARKSKNVYVCTGPLYLPRMEKDGKMYVKYEVIGTNHVAVPTHFFKVLLIEDQDEQKELLSFVMPNQKLPETRLKSYLVPLDTIERAAGLHFFEKVSRNTFKRINTIKVEQQEQQQQHQQ